MCRLRLASVLGVWWLLLPVLLVAQQSPRGASRVGARELTADGFPLVRAVRVDEGPVLDGDVLGDPAYADAVLATGFVQNRPFEGQPASERTEVRIVYTADTIYFGVVCYTDDPSTIVVADSRRDSDMTETDSFQIILDTYLDGQNGFVFGTNPAGIEYDGQVTNEGQGSGRFGGGGSGRPSNSRQQRGSGGGFNLNWDGAWQVVARVTDLGWTAEIAIPFRTLRYPRNEVQNWGVNFQRNIRVRNEQAYWSPLPRQYNINRISLAGELQDVEVPAQRNLQLTPYLLGESLYRTQDRRELNRGDLGVDLKYSVTPSMTLDLTYNTDFAQVEVDDQQINLDRFTLFFPEKRPFFLENAGLFSVGQSGAVDIFFSRRIGLGDSGEQVPIVGGGRLSGKIGRNTNVGFLNMQTASVGASGTTGQNFTVARVRQDLPNRSNIGAMLVNRQATGSLAGDRDYNRTYAFDGRWGIGDGGTVSGFAAATETPGLSGGDSHAYALNAQHQSEQVRLSLGYTEVAPDFNPEVGFLARQSYRRMNASVFTTLRPDDFMGVHEFRPHVNHNTVFDFETGRQETQFTHIDNHIEWRNGYEIHTGMNLSREGVFEPFEIFPGIVIPPGTYDHKEAQIAGNTNLGAPVSATINTIIGGLFGGDRVTITPSIAARVGETFNATFEWSYNDLRLPSGDFTTNLVRLRLSYSFTTRMFFQALVQYNDRADLWSSNLRFGLLSDANTGLFIVYNDIQGLGSEIPTGAGRTLTLKYSRLFDLLR
ncbi:MAG: hydrolase [Acidobacteria bacterium]|nr:MAG: hydrolase [Acidobacteriota bacterium]